MTTALDHELLSVPFLNPFHVTVSNLWKALHDEHPDRYPNPNSEEKRAAKQAWGVRERALPQESKATTGVLPLARQGCGIRGWLLVPGEERGTMRCDPDGDDVHLCAGYLSLDPEFRRSTFSQCYLSWLEDATSIAFKRVRA